MNRRVRRRPTMRFYLTVGIALIVVVVAYIFLMGGSKYAVLEEGTIPFQAAYPVVIIRDETVYHATNYGKAVFYASEGERVTEGFHAADVYRWGYQEKMFGDLISIQQQVQDQQLAIWKDTVDKDLNTINDKIATQTKEIASAISGVTPRDVVALERGLNALLEEKQKYLRQKVKADEKLNGLYAQETTAKTTLDSWKEKVTASGAGMISFNLDGLESVLNPADLNTLTKKDIDNAKSGVTTASIGTDTTTRPLYRLVNTYAWYVVIQADAQSPLTVMKQNEEFLMTFEGYLDRPYKGTVMGSRKPEDGGVLYYIQIQEDIGPLISVRNAVTNLRKDYTGMKVPQKALHTESNMIGIKVQAGNATEFIPVDVLMQDSDYAIIAPKEEGVALSAGMQVLLK